ncbi:hypothetical protein PQR33_35380 [Paraburkholderia sediminicola]|uniref:hypothetical protein n=1 Tax=Paraburkholderia sediminicola TaxID=458836 RepID=UPI0038BDD6B6
MKLINSVGRRAPPSACALWLALASSATALGVSVLAGWQRGGLLAERIAWVAIGAVLVVSAHVLPALCRTAPAAVRVVSTGLWLVCMITTCYGHAIFFVLAQEHAGAMRVAALPPVALPTMPEVSPPERSPVRGLAAIAAERADVTAALARANARRCFGDCPSLRVARLSLDAKLDALNIEADEAKRQQAIDDREREETARITVTRDALRDSVSRDPVMGRLATPLGVTTAYIDLASGLVFAGVLESVACLFWFLALAPVVPVDATVVALAPELVAESGRDADSVTPALAPSVAPDDSLPVGAVVRGSSPVTASHAPVVTSDSAVVPVVTSRGAATDRQPTTDLPKLAQAIEAGQVRATVADIRRYLGCSQAKATALRRQLTNANAAA